MPTEKRSANADAEYLYSTIPGPPHSEASSRAPLFQSSEPHIGAQADDHPARPARTARNGIEVLECRLHREPGFDLRLVIQRVRLLPPEGKSKQQFIEMAVSIACARRDETERQVIHSSPRNNTVVQTSGRNHGVLQIHRVRTVVVSDGQVQPSI